MLTNVLCRVRFYTHTTFLDDSTIDRQEYVQEEHRFFTDSSHRCMWWIWHVCDTCDTCMWWTYVYLLPIYPQLTLDYIITSITDSSPIHQPSVDDLLPINHQFDSDFSALRFLNQSPPLMMKDHQSRSMMDWRFI